MKSFVSFLSALLLTSLVCAQSVPNGGTITQGQVWTAPQWTSAWQSKADATSPSFTGIPIINGTPIPFFQITSAENAASVTPINFNYVAGNVLRYGADPSGITDSTLALQSALNAANSGNSAKTVFVPAGAYNFSSLSFVGMVNVSLTCASRDNTFLQFTGTGNAITIAQSGGIGGGITIRGCDIVPMSVQASGAMISIVDDYFVRIEDSGLVSPNAFNQISVTCNVNTPNQIYISGNQLFSAINDNIFLGCTNPAVSVSDIYIEPGLGQRNYIQHAGHAGIEMSGYLNGIFILENTIFANNIGIIGSDSGFGAGALASNTISHNDIDTNTTLGAQFTGLKSTNLQGNHVFTGGITCTGCSNIAAMGNHYEGGSTGLTLLGTTSWSDSGSHWSSATAPVTIGPNGSTASSDIIISGAQYVFGVGPFITFTGSSNPAARVVGSVELGSNATGCVSGANAVSTSFMFLCGTTVLQGLLSAPNGTDTASFATNVNGIGSVSLYNGSSGTGAFERLYFGNNTGAGEAMVGLTGGNFSGAFPANDLVVLSSGTLDLSYNSTIDLRINSSGVTFGAVPVNLNSVTNGGTATKYVCVDASGNMVIQVAAC